LTVIEAEYIRLGPLNPVHVSVIASRAYSPYTPDDRGMRARAEALARDWREQGRRVEIIAESDEEGEEFIHLDPQGNLVHRISGSRSYLLKAANAFVPPPGHPNLRYASRLAEKLLELQLLWNRSIDAFVVIEPRRAEALVQRAVTLARRGGHTLPSPLDALTQAEPIRSIDVIVPTYNRYEELRLMLPPLLEEIAAITRPGLEARLTVVHQNEDLPRKLFEWCSELERHPALRFVYSSPPGLTHARNAGLAGTTGDLVVFVDDDELVEPGFLSAHLQAALTHPGAAGVVGRILSRREGRMTSTHRAIGQIRLTGFVDTHFESEDDSAVLVPITPMGGNMSYRRAAMDRWFGPAWFDEALGGSAYREETSLAVEIFRRGGYLVFAPRASLYHRESSEGGSLNQDRKSLERRIEHQSLEYRFLRRFYRGLGPLGALAALGSYARDLKDIPRVKTLVAKSVIHGAGYLRGAFAVRGRVNPQEAMGSERIA
jgi:GT2 family glycosyltransferase